MPEIGIIMGSDSDLEVMKEAGDILDGFGVEYEFTICSAHRLPNETAQYAATAISKAAHLPGVIAAYTILPVIGVPIKTSTLSGVDSLYSIVQMPRGIPVATVAINGSINAALLALEILAVNDVKMAEKLIEYRKNMAAEVINKDQNLRDIGAELYLANKKGRK